MSTENELQVTGGPSEDTPQRLDERGPTQGAAAPPPPRPEGPPPGAGGALWWPFVVSVLVAIAGGVFIAMRTAPKVELREPLAATVADLSPVHAGVRLGDRGVRALSRVRAGDTLETDAAGRARLRLDNGASLLVDVDTRVVVTGDAAARLERGRLFVVGAGAAPTAIDVGSGTVQVVGANAGFDRREGLRVYAASGELVVKASGAEHTVHAGESAVFDGGVKVVPERRFDDWTGGLAAPWGAGGSPRRALGELWGRTTPGEPGSPLTIRTHEVRATVHGEIAETRAKTTFFHAGDAAVTGDYRFALPRGAIVSGFATVRGDRRQTGRPSLAARPGEAPSHTGADRLEWAGDGWVRGVLAPISPGDTVTIEVEYIELLPVVQAKGSSSVQYRYPMAGSVDAPLVGELFLRVDATPSRPRSLGAGWGARADEGVVEIRRADARPSSDFVVDVELGAPLAPARAYVTPARGEDEVTVLLRTEAPTPREPEADGVALALVLDTSSSVDPQLFEASRAFVSAVTESLGPKDRLVVLAADAVVRPVGPAAMGPVDPARKAEIATALGKLVLGGSTDLGRALEAGAEALPADAPSAMVVYVGDGWPSVGDTSLDAIRARLARRPKGSPRLGAVLVGPSTNRPLLASLVRGSGPLVEIHDSDDAARASVELLERVLVPTLTGLSADLGTGVARVFPRAELAAPTGSTITLVGRLVGELPKNVELSYRGVGGVEREKRALARIEAVRIDDVHRRFAAARVEALALEGRGREAITDAALSVGLLTPWTSLVTDGAPVHEPTPLALRVLDASAQGEAGLNAALGLPQLDGRSLASDTDRVASSLEAPTELCITLAAHRVVDAARPALRACRDARVRVRPELPDALGLSFELDGDGRPTKIRVLDQNDEPLERCVQAVVEGLSFPRLGTTGTISITRVVSWPPARPRQGRSCSPTATLPITHRRGVWQERLERLGPAQAFDEAQRGCELSTWTAKRSLLELVLARAALSGQGLAQVLNDAAQIERLGDDEAAAFLRRETLRRAAPTELAGIRAALLRQERLPAALFTERYAAARDDRARLEVVRRFLEVAPHDGRLRGRLLALLEAVGEREALLEEVRRLAQDPYADAVLLADAASTLARLGLADESRRGFGEIAERGAQDPWAQAFLGDRLRAEGLHDEAARAYAALLELSPEDAAGTIRSALAHAGAGRVDLARRSLTRVATTFGMRSGRPELAELASVLAHRIVGEALRAEGLEAAQRRVLELSVAELGELGHRASLLVFAPPGGPAPELVLERGTGDAKRLAPPDVVTGSLGLSLLRIEPVEGEPLRLVARRAPGLAPEPAYTLELVLIGPELRVSRRLELPIDGSRMELTIGRDSLGEPKRIAP